MVLEPLTFSVPDVSLEGALDQEPLEHSVHNMHLDNRPGRNELNSGPLEHPVPDHKPRRGVVFL